MYFDHTSTLPNNEHTTIGAVLHNLSRQYNLNNSKKELMLVIAPTNKSSGKILDKDMSVKDLKLDPHV